MCACGFADPLCRLCGKLFLEWTYPAHSDFPILDLLIIGVDNLVSIINYFDHFKNLVVRFGFDHSRNAIFDIILPLRRKGI